jgi:hypothetical protein
MRSTHFCVFYYFNYYFYSPDGGARCKWRDAVISAVDLRQHYYDKKAPVPAFALTPAHFLVSTMCPIKLLRL